MQNVTSSVLSLEKVLLEPSQLFGVTSLNAVQEEDESGEAVSRLDTVQRTNHILAYKIPRISKKFVNLSDRSSERSTPCSHKIRGSTSSVLRPSLRSNLITSS